jgi:DNA-binding IclR family transcriptional regulator
MADTARRSSEPRPPFQVLERTFAILERFDEEHPEWSTTELARSLGLPIPTVHRILMALRRRGYVTQHEETKRFRLGVAALQLGDRARVAVDLRAVALPVLQSLTADTGETSLLTVLTPDRQRGVCLERVESAQPLRLSVTPGRQLPLHAGASQKVLLAYLPDDDAERVIDAGLEHLCVATITDPQSLRRELARIRRRGWASSYEETNVGVWGVAVPVLQADGTIA